MNMLSRSIFVRIGCLGILAAAILALSLDGNHYWHEIRFLYASSQFSMGEILSGGFNPHQLGGKIDELGAGGFYLAKVLHIWFLHLLYNWISPAEGGFIISVLLSVLCITVSGVVSYHLFWRLFQNKRQAWLGVSCFMAMPITPYLAGKILSEVTALLFITTSILSFAVAIDNPKPNHIKFGFVSGVFTLLAALARLDILLCFAGFYIAFFIRRKGENDRKKFLEIGAVIFSIFVIGYSGTILSLGLEFKVLTEYFNNFINAGIKSNAMSVLGLLTFGGAMYILSFGACLSPNKKEARMLATWFVISAGSAILITRNYMVEPRYVISGLLPIAGLAALGLDALWNRMSNVRFKVLIITGLAVFVLIINGIALKLMPYELNRKYIIKAVENILKIDESSAILVPWSYTDFNFLSVMLPDVVIYNVNSPGGDKKLLNPYWLKRMNKWYAQAYIGNDSLLNQILSERETCYLGWRKYPPAENVKKMAEYFKFRSISRLIDTLPLKNHLAESWIWNSSSYNFEIVGKCGQYEYYKVTRAIQSS